VDLLEELRVVLEHRVHRVVSLFLRCEAGAQVLAVKLQHLTRLDWVVLSHNLALDVLSNTVDCSEHFARLRGLLCLNLNHHVMQVLY